MLAYSGVRKEYIITKVQRDEFKRLSKKGSKTLLKLLISMDETLMKKQAEDLQKERLGTAISQDFLDINKLF